MSNRMTSEELEAWLDEIEGVAPPRPKVVVKHQQVVRDANPHVSKADPNYPQSDGGFVRVRRNDFVKINMELYEAQQADKRELPRNERDGGEGQTRSLGPARPIPLPAFCENSITHTFDIPEGTTVKANGRPRTGGCLQTPVSTTFKDGRVLHDGHGNTAR